MIPGPAHVKMLADFYCHPQKLHLLSATKKLMFIDLKERGLMKEDGEGYIFLTENGDALIQIWAINLNECKGTPT